MKNQLYRILPYIVVSGFLLYWLTAIIWAMPTGYAQKALTAFVPRLKIMYGFKWKLFTPPYTYNHRLYFIVRNTGEQSSTDSIEVLQNMSLQKQKNAPFNQQESNIDYLVQRNVTGIVNTVYKTREKPGSDLAQNNSAAYMAEAIKAVATNKDFHVHLRSLNNYGKEVLRQNETGTSGKEMKIVITEYMIRPFKERNNNGFRQKEILVFETPFTPVAP